MPLRLDISPLKSSRDFRWLMASGVVTYLGSMMTYVAVPFQIKELTGSFVAVGLIGAIELIPMIIFGLYGGALADFVDRKRLVWLTEAASAALVLILFVNAISQTPKVWLIYIVVALFSAVDSLQRPSMQALIPRIVAHDQLPAASALSSLRWQAGAIVGPSIGGVLIAAHGVSTVYLIDALSFVLSLAFLARMRSVPARKDADKPSIKGIVEGIRYAMSRQDLIGTYVVDLIAMFFAFPNALFPFWADRIGGPSSLGLLYAAGTIGSMLATLTSGWVSTYRYHGRAIVIAASMWGLAVAAAGMTDVLAVVVFCLVIAGAADMVSGLFRTTIWNQTIPDHLRGRLAGIEMLSYLIGPNAGQMRAGLMADWFGLRRAIVGGGLICFGGVALAGTFLPKFFRYNSETDPNAVEQREIRKNRSDQ